MPAGARELLAQAEAGGGRSQGGASEATEVRRAAPSGPRRRLAPNPAPRPAPAQRSPAPGPAPYLGRAPRSCLKGPSALQRHRCVVASQEAGTSRVPSPAGQRKREEICLASIPYFPYCPYCPALRGFVQLKTSWFLLPLMGRDVRVMLKRYSASKFSKFGSVR